MAHHGQRRSIEQQVKGALAPKLRLGTSRHDGKVNRTEGGVIHSGQSYKTYKDACCSFAHWVEDTYKEHNIFHMGQYVQPYMDHLHDQGYSASTQKSRLSAIRKLYNGTSTDLSSVTTDARSRSTIMRSREESEYTSRHFSYDKHAEEVNMMAHLGLRRSEYGQLTPSRLVQRGEQWYVEGIKGKGGKTRDVLVRDNDERTIAFIQRFKDDEKVVPHISEACPVHALRAEYASGLYSSLKRDIDDIPPKERYYCRDDLQGTVYDKQAMQVVSDSMGHNRLSVIAENYLWKL